MVGIPPRKISSFLQPVMDDLLKRNGVYIIPVTVGYFTLGKITNLYKPQSKSMITTLSLSFTSPGQENYMHGKDNH